MMSRLISLSLFSVASSYQIADTHAHVDYEGMKSAMVSIAQKARKGAIDQDSIDAIEGFLNTITNTLIPALNQDKDDVQAILDGAIEAVHGCDADRETWIGTVHAGNVLERDGAKETHGDCRKKEATAYCDYVNTCQTFETQTCNWRTKDVPDFTHGDSDEVNEYMIFLGQFFDENSGSDRTVGEGLYYDQRNACINKTNTYHKRVETCDKNQLDFEHAWCTTESELANYCQDTYRSCRCTKERLFEEEQEEARGLEQIFQTQFVALQHLECYGQKILENQTINLEECLLDKKCTDFNDATHTCPELVYNQPRAAVPCNEVQQEYPCTPQWISNHYGTYGGPENMDAIRIDGVTECEAYTPAAQCFTGGCSNTIVTSKTQNAAWNNATDCPNLQ